MNLNNLFKMKNPIMYQRWLHVVFLHFSMESEKLQKLVPFKLDLYKGKAILSIVPFVMDRIRFAYTPSIPGFSKLCELNLRTYVEVNGINGVYFFTLDTDSIVGTFIANHFFHLPYKKAQISIKNQENSMSYFHERENLKFNIDFKLLKNINREKSEFEIWTTERYRLFTKLPSMKYAQMGVVNHDPWILQDICIEKLEDQFSVMLGPDLDLQFISASYTKELNVSFNRFQKVINYEQ
jgi:uncharacterized protein YqjF (DUF2071 family)